MSAIPKDLEKSLQSGLVVPFVGAGVSMSVRDRTHNAPLFPSWKNWLLKASEFLEEQQKPNDANFIRASLDIDKPDYLFMASHAKSALGSSWPSFLKMHLDPNIEQAEDQSLSLARTIWGLNSSLIITTNYDRVLHWACPKQHDLRTWNIQATIEQGTLIRDGILHPTIWHLHGSIDNSNDIILTSDSYSRLYDEGKYAAALTTLRFLLASRTFLFIGFSLDDAHFKSQLQEINNIYSRSIDHYVLVHRSEVSRAKASGLPVHIVPFDDFGEPLLALVQQMSNLASTHTNEKITVNKLRGIYEQADPEVVDQIITLMADILHDGHAPLSILKHLNTMRISPDTDTLLRTSVKVADIFEEDLNRRQLEVKTKEEEYTKRLAVIHANMNDVEKIKNRLLDSSQIRSKKLKADVISSFETMVARLPSKVEEALMNNSLSDGSFWERFKLRKLSQKAVAICENVIKDQLVQWSDYCTSDLLLPHKHALEAEIMGGLSNLQNVNLVAHTISDKFDLNFGLSDLYEYLDKQSDFQIERLINTQISTSAFMMLGMGFPDIVFLILAVLVSRDMEAQVKLKTLDFVVPRIREVATEATSRLDAEVSSIMNNETVGISDQLRGLMDSVLNDIGKYHSLIEDSSSTATKDVARLEEAAQRAMTLRHTLNASLKQLSS